MLKHNKPNIPRFLRCAETRERYQKWGLTVEAVFRYRSWKEVGFQPGRPQNRCRASWRYLGAPVNSSLSFRKEAIQRSSSASETMNRALQAQNARATHEQRPISLTITVTATIR